MSSTTIQTQMPLAPQQSYRRLYERRNAISGIQMFQDSIQSKRIKQNYNEVIPPQVNLLASTDLKTAVKILDEINIAIDENKTLTIPGPPPLVREDKLYLDDEFDEDISNYTINVDTPLEYDSFDEPDPIESNESEPNSPISDDE